MRTPLENALNLPSLADLAKEMEDPEKQNELVELDGSMQNLATKDEKTAVTLEEVMVDPKGLAEHDTDMDDVAEQAQDSFDKLMELGFTTEARFSGAIFDNALRALEIKYNAKNAKAEKKVRLLRLHVDAKRLERDMRNQEGMVDDGSGMVGGFSGSMSRAIERARLRRPGVS